MRCREITAGVWHRDGSSQLYLAGVRIIFVINKDNPRIKGLNTTELENALRAVGELLQAEGARAAIVVVGGASLSLLGLVPRTTRDVDVIARVEEPEPSAAPEVRPTSVPLVPPEPLPEPLVRAIGTVARDFGLPPDWMNTDVALQWRSGLPPGLEDGLSWRRYNALRVGLVGRRALIALKLFAAVDGGPGGVHFQDLVALDPTDDELAQAAAWVRTQDASSVFGQMVGEVVTLVRERER